ncbi:hypothetical protein L7F22_000943 [Adiantum nelumboides]|nr:hypothetical protein [Adiantum nelumboides]
MSCDVTVDWRNRGRLQCFQEGGMSQSDDLARQHTHIPALACRRGTVWTPVKRGEISGNETGMQFAGASRPWLFYIHRLVVKTIREISDGTANNAATSMENRLFLLFQWIVRILKRLSGQNVWIVIDDVSLLEVVTQGNSAHVRDFLHYCRTLASDQQICSLLLLTHRDVYEDTEETLMAYQLEYMSDTVIDVEPLATGQATDVHGQVIVEHKVPCNLDSNAHINVRQDSKGCRLHFKLSENTVQFFAPGKHI